MKSYKIILLVSSVLFSSLVAMQSPTPPNKGARNPADNSCFLNSAIQALFHTRPLRDFLEKHKEQYGYVEKEASYDKNSSTSVKFIKYIDQLDATKPDATKKTEATSAREFRNSFPDVCAGKEIKKMIRTKQHDAQEFLSYILDRLCVEIVQNDKDVKKEFSAIFGEENEATQNLFRILTENTSPSTKYDATTLFNLLRNKSTDSSIIATRNDLYDAILQESFSWRIKNIDVIINFINSKKSNQDTSKYKFANDLKNELNDESLTALLRLFQSLRYEILPKIKEPSKKKEKIKEEFNTLVSNQKNQADKDQLENLAKKYVLINLYDRLSDLGIPKEEKGALINYHVLFAVLESKKNRDFSKLTDALNKALALQKEFRGIFELTLRSTIKEKGEKNTHTSETLTPNWMLQLQIPDPAVKITLQDILREFFEQETLDEWRCDICGNNVQATKQLAIKSLPDILSIQLKRFGFDTHTETSKKINTPITFPIDVLNVGDYLRQDVKEKKEENTFYKLFAIVIHEGNVGGGHYHCYARWENDWFHYNDATVTYTNPDDIEKIGKQELESGAPYLLFYERAKNDEIKGLKELYNKQKIELEEQEKEAKIEEAKKSGKSLENLRTSLQALKKTLSSLSKQLIPLMKK